MTVEKIVPSGAAIHYLRGNFPTSSARNAHDDDRPNGPGWGGFLAIGKKLGRDGARKLFGFIGGRAMPGCVGNLGLVPAVDHSRLPWM
jgi:hypothetical protein